MQRHCSPVFIGSGLVLLGGRLFHFLFSKFSVFFCLFFQVCFFPRYSSTASKLWAVIRGSPQLTAHHFQCKDICMKWKGTLMRCSFTSSGLREKRNLYSVCNIMKIVDGNCFAVQVLGSLGWNRSDWGAVLRRERMLHLCAIERGCLRDTIGGIVTVFVSGLMRCRAWARIRFVLMFHVPYASVFWLLKFQFWITNLSLEILRQCARVHFFVDWHNKEVYSILSSCIGELYVPVPGFWGQLWVFQGSLRSYTHDVFLHVAFRVVK